MHKLYFGNMLGLYTVQMSVLFIRREMFQKVFNTVLMFDTCVICLILVLRFDLELRQHLTFIVQTQTS